jgi:hypothetical protein
MLPFEPGKFYLHTVMMMWLRWHLHRHLLLLLF